MEFDVIQGDIAEQRADALVNAAGTSLRIGSGVAGALRRRAGEALNRAAIELGPVGLGEVAVTDAFDLDARYVIHAAAMPYSDGRATVESVTDATEYAFRAGDRLECRSLVIPVLGTGAAGLDFDAGARAVCSTVASYEPTSLEEVSVIAYDRSQYERLAEMAATVRPGT